MEQSEIQRILSAPLSRVARANDEECEVFADKKEGWCFTFGLASGQRFVGHISAQKQLYTFRPLNNLVPNLQEIAWERKKEIYDLGYTTTCRTLAGTSDEEKTIYTDVLSPKPEDSSKFPLTKIDFKYYSYHPLLERARNLQMAKWEHERLKEAMQESQKCIQSLLISDEESNLIQQKLKERRQNG